MNKKILIIEDEPEQIEVLKIRLEANNFEVISALDGEEGLAKANKEKPDLILLDIVMPKINGYEVCKHIKQNPEMKNIPIIVISAIGAKDFEERCLDAGAEECIRKPYDSADVVTRIKKHLKV